MTIFDHRLSIANPLRRHVVATAVLIGALSVTGSVVLAAPDGGTSPTTTQPLPTTVAPTVAPSTAPPTSDTPTSPPTSGTGPGTSTTVPTAPTSTVTTVATTTTTRPATSSTTAPTSTDSSTTTTATPPISIDPAVETTLATVAPTTAPPLPAPQNITVYPEQVGHILATIRHLESRGQYFLPPNRGNASGAYQFIASTWRNYGGYPHAYLAPPAVQDERAALDVTKFLAQWNNDVSMIPVMWYYPRAAYEPALMDVVPVPSAGNVLTIREYQQRWLTVFARISGEPVPAAPTLEEATSRLALAPTPPVRDDDLPSLEFPVVGPSNIAVLDCDTEVPTEDLAGVQLRDDIEAAGLCSDAAPSVVFGVKLQPVRSATDGIVTRVDDVPGSGRPISLTITDVNGRRYVYSGFNDDNPGTSDGSAPAHLRLTALGEVGRTVWAGQIIGFMGDTDPLPVDVRADVATADSVSIDPTTVAPHIRLTIIDLDGTPVDAFGPVLDALFRTGCGTGIGRWSVPARAELIDQPTDAVVVPSTDDDDAIDSKWVITPTGQVTASGWAAMISPGADCAWTLPETYGPGAAGSDELPARWWTGLDLATDVWLGVALAEEQVSPRQFFLF